VWTRAAAFMLLVLFAGVLAAPSPSAQAGATPTHNPEAAAALRSRGLEFGYNLDHAEALIAFSEAIAADPSDPALYRLLAGATWITLLFQQGIITVDDYLGQARAHVPRSPPAAGLARTFQDALRQALTLSEQRLKDHPADANAHYQAGAAFGFLASYTATIEGRVLGSLGSARRAYHQHERVLKLDPRRKDAGLIVGMYRYGVAALPAPQRLMARLAGFGGGRERGLRMVEEAARYPSDVQPNALFTLILMYNREARYDDALRVIGDLQQRYHRNRLLWLEAGNTALRAGRHAEARAALEEGLRRLSQDVRPRARGEEGRWRHAYGVALAGLGEVDAAERELRAALGDASRDWVRGRTYKELGKLADLAGNRPRALEQYRLAERFCRQDHDSECSQELKRLLK
jgi:tetratricopeptide (TPR) repeat protein